MKKKQIDEVWYRTTLFKSLRIMRLTLGLLLIFAAQSWALKSYSQKTVFNLDMKNTDIVKVLEEIENQTDYYFLFNYEQIQSDKTIDVKLTNSKIDEALDYLLKGTHLRYEIMNRQIIIAKEETVLKNMFTQQSKKVSGKVSDPSGTPLPGVSIIIKETTRGTVTDFEGNFSLSNVPVDATLVFSFVGMKTQEVDVAGQSTFDVILEEDAIGIDEVVAIGYGVIKKSDLTGSVSSIKSDDIQERPATNLIEKMQGKAAGIDIVQSSGQPGSVPTIRIRGRRSFSASNEPLYVVDGIPFQQGNMNDLNPNDIESIEILKDAASSAIYGSRGANGVILITTKRGSSGKSQISYDGYYGITQASRMVDMMNGEEFAEMKREAHRASNSYTSDELLFDADQLENLRNGVWYDYPDMIFGTGYRTDHRISFSGGNQKTQFALSGGFFDEQGTISNTYYKRYSLRINLDHQMNQWLKAGTSTTMSRSLKDIAGSSAIGHAFRNSPLGNAFDPETGELVFLPTSDGLLANPLFDLDPKNLSDESKINRIFSSVYGEIDFLKFFKYKLNFGFDIYDYRRGEFYGSETTRRLGGDALVKVTNKEEFNYTLEHILNYNRQIKKNKFDVTLMQSVQSYSNEDYGATVTGLPYESQKWYNMDSGATVNNINSQLTEWSLVSLMGRLNYVYDDRYLLQASIRSDGSSRLSEGNKWSYFPSGAVGWRIINEPWMKDIDWISLLKLRVSYGVTGNTAIDPYQTQGALSQTTYSWDERLAQGYKLSDIPNPGLKWEKTATIDGGLDFGLFRGKLSGSVDFYQATTTNLLMERQLPSTSGYVSTLENIGSTRNKGIEINLNGVVVDRNNGLNWTIDLNWFSNKEEIVELYGGKEDDIGNKWFIGHPTTVFYDYEKIGVWQTEESEIASGYGYKPGDIKVKDQNADDILGADDRVILGSDVPKWSMGLTSRMEFKGFDFSFFITSVLMFKNYVH